jgi:4-hydroxy-4-methyl-2-oxoglutarate aldolase
MTDHQAATIAEDPVERLDALFPAVVSDMLDAIGYRSQVMAPRVRPLFPAARVVGRAATVRTLPVEEVPKAQEDQYKLHLEAIEALRPREVMVTSRIEVCFWGELLSIAARNRGATGVVVDGFTRDVKGIEELGFPVFCTGISAADALGRSDVVEYGGTVVSGGVTVNAGDLIIGDVDGVVVVPLEVAEDVLTRAEEKVEGENLVRQKLEEGMPVIEAFQRYGIL